MILASNLSKMELEPCRKCGGYDVDYDKDGNYISPPGCNEEDHWVPLGPQTYNHFQIKGKWYVCPRKWVIPLLTLVEIENAMNIQGTMHRPYPTRINRSLTSLFSLMRKCGVTDEQIATQFPSQQVNRMKGRVFQRLVKGK